MTVQRSLNAGKSISNACMLKFKECSSLEEALRRTTQLLPISDLTLIYKGGQLHDNTAMRHVAKAYVDGHCNLCLYSFLKISPLLFLWLKRGTGVFLQYVYPWIFPTYVAYVSGCKIVVGLTLTNYQMPTHPSLPPLPPTTRGENTMSKGQNKKRGVSYHHRQNKLD